MNSEPRRIDARDMPLCVECGCIIREIGGHYGRPCDIAYCQDCAEHLDLKRRARVVKATDDYLRRYERE